MGCRHCRWILRSIRCIESSGCPWPHCRDSPRNPSHFPAVKHVLRSRSFSRPDPLACLLTNVLHLRKWVLEFPAASKHFYGNPNPTLYFPFRCHVPFSPGDPALYPMYQMQSLYSPLFNQHNPYEIFGSTRWTAAHRLVRCRRRTSRSAP